MERRTVEGEAHHSACAAEVLGDGIPEPMEHPPTSAEAVIVEYAHQHGVQNDRYASACHLMAASPCTSAGSHVVFACWSAAAQVYLTKPEKLAPPSQPPSPSGDAIVA